VQATSTDETDEKACGMNECFAGKTENVMPDELAANKSQGVVYSDASSNNAE